MTYHRGVGQVTPAQVQPWLNLATQTATSIAQAVQQGQQPQTPMYDPAMYSPSPYAPAPTQQNWVVPVMLGGGLLLALGVGYVALNKRMQPNRRRRRRRRTRRVRRNSKSKGSATGWRELFRFETKAEADAHARQAKRSYALMSKRGMAVPESKIVPTGDAREPYAFVVRHKRS